MKLSQFKFDLPLNLIAQNTPVEEEDTAQTEHRGHRGNEQIRLHRRFKILNKPAYQARQQKRQRKPFNVKP